MRRYRFNLLAMLALLVIGLNPTLLAPLGRAYIAFCARFLTGTPFGHHYPPLLVAFLAPVSVVLVLGFLIAVLRQTVGQRALDRRLTAHRADPDDRTQGLLPAVGAGKRIITTDDASVYAFCAGLIRPRMYVSQGLLALLAPDELEAVLRHELRHMQRRDPLRFFVGSLWQRLAPVFPVLEVLAQRSRLHAEIAADREAIAAVGMEPLASALIKVVRAAPTVEYRAIVASLSATDARVAALLGEPSSLPVDRRDLILSAACALAALSLAVWLALQSLPMPPACGNCPAF